MTSMLRAFLFFVLAVSLPCGAQAGKFEDIEKTAQHFEAVALMLETTGKPAALSKWVAPPIIKVHDGKEHHKELDGLLNELGKLTGLGFQTQKKSGKRANFEIFFMPTAEIREKTPLKRANCAFLSGRRKDGSIVFAKVYISTDTPEKTRHCIYQEVTQALGLRNDSEIVPDSIFNDRIVRFSLSDTDRILIRTLYDRRLKPGMAPEIARPIALGIIAELMR
jgi:hypothetical protein